MYKTYPSRYLALLARLPEQSVTVKTAAGYRNMDDMEYAKFRRERINERRKGELQNG